MTNVHELAVRMKTRTINFFTEYVEYTEKYKGHYYFRGQSDVAWDITPSSFRLGKPSTLDFERKAIANKIDSNPNLSPLSALFELQHYGIPTRICDLSISHLCALFFSCEGSADGAVFVISKESVINLDSYEMNIFSLFLERGISSIYELQKESSDTIDAVNVILKNYVVAYKDLCYTNPRAFRQGGTGIVFGCGKCGDEIISSGSPDIDDLIVEKIIIPYSVKTEAIKELRKLGYSKDMLYDTQDGYDEVSLMQTDLRVEKRFDKAAFNKIIAKYRIDSLYFDRYQLALEIGKLYEMLFAQYGKNARICTFFYFDQNDCGSIPNWICLGVWRKDTQYTIEWMKSYHSYRLNHLNEQISRKEAVGKYTKLAKKVLPYCDRIFNYAEKPNYSLDGFLTLVKEVQPAVSEICNEANNIPFSDEKTETFTNKVCLFINDVDWFVGDMMIFFNRTDLKEKTIRWMIDRTYIQKCRQSKENCFIALNEMLLRH